MSCFKFEFESPYEDVNGIYVQLIKYYSNYSGQKLVIEGQYGYLLRKYIHTSRIEKYNFVDIDSIYSISDYVLATTNVDFEISQGYAYVVLPWSLDIINFEGTEPSFCGYILIPGGAHIIKLQGNNAYLGSDSSLYIVDVSDKTNPQIISSCNFSDEIECIAVDSQYAYILLVNYDFFIVNIQQPEEPGIIFQETIGGASLFALNGRYLYFNILYYNQIHTYEITDVGSIEYITALNLPYSLRFLYVGETYGLTSDIGSTYLLNLEYPAQPCVSEVLEGDDSYYGVVKGDYIYLLRPILKIFEIKEVQE
ncbi:hypothetical protein AMJ52_07845 [candidate division TA06 bacterium DG_78]|uniref:LVIVD repeat protein n=1 Tax=candidate division TA06 bacterium DG_78 TaxID=1703772 RepID=A0A0S7YBL0_UNCT6|nr:MAG: hypothetical protein AMJ52_07845 [candidate division TA06 bacterium DG_78]